MLQYIVPGSGFVRICRNGCMKQNTIAKVSSLYGFISYSKLITLDAILLKILSVNSPSLLTFHAGCLVRIP